MKEILDSIIILQIPTENEFTEKRYDATAKKRKRKISLKFRENLTMQRVSNVYNFLSTVRRTN